MGFGFNLLFIFVLMPLTIILLVGCLLTRKVLYGKVLGFIWLLILILMVFSFLINAITEKKKLRRKDFTGGYIVDRSFFSGRNANWQYDTFKFEIKENDSLYFYIMEGGRPVKKIVATIKTLDIYPSHRLIINVSAPRSHLIDSIPTIYRDGSSFHLIFNSSKFGNMYYKKGSWHPR